MEKKLYFELDNGDGITTMQLSGCMAWIQGDTTGIKEEDTEDMQYTLTPVWLTDAEYEALPDAEV